MSMYISVLLICINVLCMSYSPTKFHICVLGLYIHTYSPMMSVCVYMFVDIYVCMSIYTQTDYVYLYVGLCVCVYACMYSGI